MTSPAENLRINLNLTSAEAKSVQTIYDQLVNIDLFKEIPQESYQALDKFLKAVNIELHVQELANRKGFEWGEKCGHCAHSSTDHAQNGVGLCVAESCRCMTMVLTGKPF